jgi:transposase
MKKKKMYQKIQAFKRQGYCRNEIASRLGIDPQTAAKYYLMDEREFRVYQQKQMFRDKALQEHEKDILQVYEKNEFKKLNMSAVYDYLEERYGSLPGNEQTLRNYIRYLIRTDKLKLNESIRIYSKVPELPFGKQMQLDFGQYRMPGGLKLFIFAALLSASRYRYITFQDHPFNTKEVICHLLSCFDYFGGVPREMVIDQDRLLVVSENAGDIIYTADFRYFIQEQDIRMYVCRKADPESKGKVENLIKYVKRNFLSIRDFHQVEEANEGAFRWLKRRANGKISQATQKIPALLIEHERKKLRPVCPSLFGKSSLSKREERNVNEKACISVQACNYQLPARYQKKTVEIYQSKEQLFVFDSYTGKEIVNYPLCLIPGKTIPNREFTREREKNIGELKTSTWKMFSEESWQVFCQKNFQRFSRYCRDQCLEAKRYFLQQDIKLEILQEALGFCLENETLSFANLKDTYDYLLNLPEKPKTILPDLPYSKVQPIPVKVHQRKLTAYQQILQKEVAR